MKSFHLSSLACVSFDIWLAYATPVIPTITALPHGSPYPTPTTNEFQYLNYDEKNEQDKRDRLAVHSAFLSFAQILRAAISAVDDVNDDTYNRWFPKEVLDKDFHDDKNGRRYVGDVYRRLLADDNTPKPVIAKLVHDHKDSTDDGKGRELCKAHNKAYMLRDSGKFHICKLDQPAAITDPAKCAALGNEVSGKMDSLTGTLTHEFMHWNLVGEKVGGILGHIFDVVYGAPNCMRMAKGKNSQWAFINADSYKWMALNAYYNKLCNKKFGDPIITKEEFQASELEEQDSNEISPDCSSGALDSA